ncbi:MAG TPA: energy transducer TonB [Nitrosomonas sp.]|nr:energy transducer TonB [Nitrosomonas sp.]
MKTMLLVCVTFGIWIAPTMLYSQSDIRDATKHLFFTEAISHNSTDELSQDNSVGLEKAPVVITRVDPKYPDVALRAGVEGKVTVSALVNENGDVIDTRIIKTSDKIFETSALDAAHLWKFSPGVSKGKTVSVWVTIPFQFMLPSSQKGESENYSSFLGSLQQIAMNIIRGRKFEQINAVIESDAYIIDGNHYENLYAVLHGEVKTCNVVEGPNSQVSYFHAWLTEEATAASLVLKTTSANGRRVRFHTVLLTKQVGGEWKIKSWHVSG